MITRIDMTGSGLVGAADGRNRLFTTSQSMRLERVVDVWVDGVLRHPDASNGYQLLDTTTVELAEAPYTGEQVMVRYCAEPVVVGIPDGTPLGLQAELLWQPLSAEVTVPGPISADVLLPPPPIAEVLVPGPVSVGVAP